MQDIVLRMTMRAMKYSFYYSCQRCCATCSSFTSCENVCPKLAQQAREKKEQQKKTRDADTQRRAEEGRKYREQVTRLWQRFREAREAAGKSAGDCMDALDWRDYSWDEEKFSQAEQSGPDDMSNAVYADLPYGFEIDLECIQPLLDAADFLGCSLDYLLCRTDKPNGDTAPAEGCLPLQWLPGQERPQQYGQQAVAKFRVDAKDTPRRMIAEWNGSRWRFPNGGATIDAECVGWFPIPVEEEGNLHGS